jgi:hypothetical protein
MLVEFTKYQMSITYVEGKTTVRVFEDTFGP